MHAIVRKRGREKENTMGGTGGREKKEFITLPYPRKVAEINLGKAF